MQIRKVNEKGIGEREEKAPAFARGSLEIAWSWQNLGGEGDSSQSRIPQNLLLICKTSIQAHFQFQQFRRLALAFKTL